MENFQISGYKTSPSKNMFFLKITLSKWPNIKNAFSDQWFLIPNILMVSRKRKTVQPPRLLPGRRTHMAFFWSPNWFFLL